MYSPLRGVVLAIRDQHLVTHAGQVAELADRGLPRLSGRHAARDQRVDPRLEVECDLVVHVADESRAAERDAEHATHMGVPSVLEGSIGFGRAAGKPWRSR